MGRVGYVFWLGFFRRVVLLLPHRGALALGVLMARLLWLVDKSHVDSAEVRCVRVLGLGISLARKVVRQSYENLGRSVVEFLRLEKIGRRLSSYVTVHGEENLARAYKRGKGVILLTAHFGNWEFAAARIAQLGYPMNAIGAPQREEVLTELIARLRESAGVRTLGKGFDLRRSLECLKKGELLGILLDQDPREQGVVVPFLGRPASTPQGPVKIAYRRDALVVPLFIVRREGGVSHDLYLLPPLEGEKDEPFGKDIVKALEKCNHVLSEWIARYPQQWMWLYPRWASTLGKEAG